MVLDWKVFMIVCPLVFLAGFVDAVGGGGGLISLPAYLMAGLPAHMALGSNKFSSSCGTLISTVRYCKNGCVDWPVAIPGIVAALAGAQIGARLSLIVNESIFRIILLVLLPLIALYVLFRKEDRPEKHKEVPRKRQFVLVAVFSLIFGMYDGFYGPGTGTFLILVYTGLCHMDTLKAAGNKSLVNLSSNISSLVVFLTSGVVLLPLAATASVFSIAGHWLGAGVAMKNGRKIVRIVILCVLMLLFIRVLSETLG